jgi:hypothetical protein
MAGGGDCSGQQRGGQVRQGEQGKMAGGGSVMKLKPIVIGDIVREAEKEETMHYMLLGLGDNNYATGEKEKGKKKQWRLTSHDEDEA